MIESVLIVGTAVGKAVAKLWLKDDVARAASDSLLDIVKDKVSGTLERREVVRQFTAIGDRVAASLEPLFVDARLEEGDENAVALTVAETLDRASINARLLTEERLNPSELVKRLKLAHPEATTAFSADGTALYDRVIAESASYIVDISSKLPGFVEHTVRAMLEGQVDLLQVATAVLEEVRALREDARRANPERDVARSEEEYRRAIIRNLDYVDLYGVDVDRASRRQRLSVAYIGLYAEATRQLVPGVTDGATGAQRPGRDDRGSVEVTGSKQPVEEILAGAHRLVIRGPAGSGKSTLLRWTAVNAARQGLSGVGNSGASAIPFLVRLRDYVGAALPLPHEFVHPKVFGAIKEEIPEGWVAASLRSGRAVLMVDGVDEMPRQRREEVRAWLLDLAGIFDKAAIIVTSRPEEIEQGWIEGGGFAEVALRPMDLADIESFIEHWHRAVYEELTDEEERESQVPARV